MSVYHLLVVMPVPTLWAVLCVHVKMDMDWIVMDHLALVGKLKNN